MERTAELMLSAFGYEEALFRETTKWTKLWVLRCGMTLVLSERHSYASLHSFVHCRFSQQLLSFPRAKGPKSYVRMAANT